jgi:sigma-54 dependent transcriptional regulator, acetoin dehydrogenase operon transcriptional activator AcoR
MEELRSPTFIWPCREDMRAIAVARDAFLSGKTTGLEHIRPVIRESWQRCYRLHVNPNLQKIPVILTAEKLEQEQEGADLISVAAPIFETISTALETERFLLGVSDCQGQLLHLNGHADLLQQARAMNAVPGGALAEDQVGTTIANVVLSQGQPDYVLWSEHYCHTFHHWASLGAPIHHPLTHEVIGVAMMSGEEPNRFFTKEMLERLVQRLEQLLHHEELRRRVALLDVYHRLVLRYPQDIVLALDGRGHIRGASSLAVQLVNTPHELLDTSLLRVPGLHVQGLRPVSEIDGEESYELLVTAAERNLIFQATAIPVPGQRQPVGTIVVLPHPRPPRRSRALTPSSSWRVRYTFTDLIGKAPAFQGCLDLAHQAAQHDFPVLLLGESGSGKELLAQAIHSASARCHGPFVAVNCGVANDELLAAELFGYVEGAFTGAAKGGRAGKLELAHGGTLLLDEIDAMSPKMQVSLLRVLEEEKITRVGAERPVVVDMRVIAASNEDLKMAITQKRFRLDLYHRLCALLIQVPSLRERTNDILILSRHLLPQLGFSRLRLSNDALALLKRYHWPGNVRELRNVLLRSAQHATGTLITPQDIPKDVTAEIATPSSTPSGSLRASEQDLILRALADTHGNMQQAAARLGVHQSTLYRKLQRYGLSAKTGELALALNRRRQ